MSRPLRIDYPGAYHHVMNRGAAQQATFRSVRDREEFSSLWAEATVRFGIVVLAYAWMGNHFHALVFTPDAQLSESLRYIIHVYTQRFNRRNGRDGPLFRGRFHSILIDSDIYLHRVARYIERNPLDAGLVTPEELLRYRWSSLRHYLNPTPGDWVTTQPLISRMGSRRSYLKHVLSELPDEELEAFYGGEQRQGVILGDQQFVDSLPAEVQKLGPIIGVQAIALEEIDEVLVRIRAQSHLGPRTRFLAAELGQLLARSSRQDLANHYNFASLSTVSSAIARSKADPQTIPIRQAAMAYFGRPVLQRQAS